MVEYTIAWFIASLFGTKYAANLTVAQYEFAFTLAESELESVKCWCPKLYPHALSIKISLILDASGLGLAVSAPPVVSPSGGTQDAYVIEDEVFDVRRKYKLVDKATQAVTSSPVAQLDRIILNCKPPMSVGATLARGIGGALGCCGNGIGDKAEFRYDHHGY